MPLKFRVDTLDSVPEALRGEYEETADKKGFQLKVEGTDDAAPVRKALGDERKAREAAEKKLKDFEGLDPEELRALKARIEGDEELQLIQKGDKEKLRERWTGNMKKDFEKQLKARDEKITASETKAARLAARALDNAIREALSKSDLHPYAVEDALLHARNEFTLDENGDVVKLDKDGGVVMGKSGSPFSPQEWIEGKRESRPHWFPASGTGGGAQQQDRRSSTNSKTIKRSQFDKMDPKAQMDHVKAGGAVID